MQNVEQVKGYEYFLRHCTNEFKLREPFSLDYKKRNKLLCHVHQYIKQNAYLQAKLFFVVEDTHDFGSHMSQSGVGWLDT
jgi:hypothetical protein